jgi:hypothetical protein
MWPFKHKQVCQPARSEFDLAEYELTVEEKHSIRAVFKNFIASDGTRIGMETHPPEVTRGLSALGLWHYAEQEMEAAEFYAHPSQRATRTDVIDKAIQAISKAYSIHRLPIYLFDLARYLNVRGLPGPAREAFRDFLLAQSKYKEGSYDHLFMHGRDIEQAIQETEESLTGMQETFSEDDPRSLHNRQSYKRQFPGW